MYDGIIYQQDVFIVEFCVISIEFMVYGFMVQLLVWYDKGMFYVMIFDKFLVVWFVENMGNFQCDIVGGFWDRDYDVDVQIFLFMSDFFVKFGVYIYMSVVDGDFVDKGVWVSKINVFKQIGVIDWVICVLVCEQLFFFGNIDSFVWCDIVQEFKVQCIQCYVFRSDYIFCMIIVNIMFVQY